MNNRVKHDLKTAAFVLSLFFNAAFAVFFAIALSGKTASVSFLDMEKLNGGAAYLTGACVVSVPEAGASLVFGPAEFTLSPGDVAAYQFSAVSGGGQLNMACEPLYDRAVVAVEKSGYGLVITALSPGEAVLQTLTADGIRDLARVTVARRALP